MPSIPSVPLMSARPSFASSTSGVSPASASARRGVAHRPVGARDLALADEREPAVRERGEIAAGSERPMLGHDRCEARVQQPGDRLGDDRPRAGQPRRERARAQEHHRSHDLALHRRAHAGGVRAQERAL